MERPLTLPREEDQDVAPLQLAHDLDGDFVALGAADDGGKAGHAAVDQLDAPGAQLHVVDGTVQIAVALPSLPCRAGIRAGEAAAGHVEAGYPLRLFTLDKAHRFDDLGGQQRRHAAVQRFAQVGRPAVSWLGMGCSRSLACSRTGVRSPSLVTSRPVMPRMIGR